MSLKKGFTSYTASSLEDIAKMFDGLAIREDQAAEVEVSTQKARMYHRGAAYAYRDTAQVLRATKITGAA